MRYRAWRCRRYSNGSIAVGRKGPVLAGGLPASWRHRVTPVPHIAVIEPSTSGLWRLAADQLRGGSTGTRPLAALHPTTKRTARHIAARTHVARNVAKEFDAQPTPGQRAADAVASFGGSWTFVGLFAAAMLFWPTALLQSRQVCAC